MGEKASGELSPRDVIDYWLGVGEAKWYSVDLALDADVNARFGALWRAAKDGELSDWENSVEGALGLLILLDQFPRNMFRGQGQAFSTDAMARDVALRALSRGYDLAFPARARIFFYLPLMHSENPADQDMCVHLVQTRLGSASANLSFAIGHRETIRKFGRFPMRNAALGRVSSADEAAYIAAQNGH